MAREQLKVEGRGNSSFTIHERGIYIGRLRNADRAGQHPMFDVAGAANWATSGVVADLDRLGYRYGPGLR